MLFTDEQLEASIKMMVDIQQALGGDPAEVAKRLKAMHSNVEEFRGLNLAKVLEEWDKRQANLETAIKAIRSSRRGVHVPGLEDESLNMLRAVVSYRQGGRKVDFERRGGGKEFEILKAAAKARAEQDPVFARAAQSVGDDELGGFFVPDQVIPDVIAAIYRRSQFINLDGEGGQTRISVVDGLTSPKVRIPKFEGGMVAYWIGEDDDYVESQAKTGTVTMDLHKLGVLALITKEMEEFGGMGFDALFRRDMVRSAAEKLDQSIAFAKGGKNSPTGIFNTPGVKLYSAQSKGAGVIGDALGSSPFQADWQGAPLSFDVLSDMDLVLEEDDIVQDESSTTITSPRAIRHLKQMKVDNYSGQSANQPYILGLPMISDAKLAEIIGPYAKSNHFKAKKLPGQTVDAPTTSAALTSTSVLKGNLSEVVLGRSGGIEIDSDEGRGTKFVSDGTYMKLRMHAGIAIRQERALIICPDVIAA